MRRWICCLGVLSLLSLAERLLAAEPCFGFGRVDRELECARCAAIPCCCADDYCRKPLPCIPCAPLQGCGDDYCRKPLPCLPPVCTSGCADDYCRKPLPHFCCPEPWQSRSRRLLRGNLFPLDPGRESGKGRY